MKDIKKILGLVLLISALGACSKWVEFDPLDQYEITEEDGLKSEADYQSMAVSCYSPLQWLNQAILVGDIASDNSVSGGESARDILEFQTMDDYTMSADNIVTTEIYRAAYEGINRVNYLFQYKEQNIAGETIDFAGKEALYGELHFLRSYYYFTLVKFFGDVVLFTEKKLEVSDFGTLQRAPKADVYAQIELDLNAAIAVLPPTNSQPGRVTKYAAQALLGKVLLYQEKFDEAAAMLQNVIGKFQLVDNFGSIFSTAGENGPESVFEIQYSNNQHDANWGVGQSRGQGNFAAHMCGVRQINSPNAAMPYAPGWSIDLPTQELAAAYEDGDLRKEATILDIEAYVAANPSYDITYTPAPYKGTGLYNNKYQPINGESGGQIELNNGNNQRTMRYAEVLLMAAEANNRGTGGDDIARGFLNEVRHRAFGGDLSHYIPVSVTGNELTQAIWEERRLELAMEGDRFFDLVRTGQAASEITGFVVGKNEVFPIPQLEVDISGISQNPNWN